MHQEARRIDGSGENELFQRDGREAEPPVIGNVPDKDDQTEAALFRASDAFRNERAADALTDGIRRDREGTKKQRAVPAANAQGGEADRSHECVSAAGDETKARNRRNFLTQPVGAPREAPGTERRRAELRDCLSVVGPLFVNTE